MLILTNNREFIFLFFFLFVWIMHFPVYDAYEISLSLSFNGYRLSEHQKNVRYCLLICQTLKFFRPGKFKLSFGSWKSDKSNGFFSSGGTKWLFYSHVKIAVSSVCALLLTHVSLALLHATLSCRRCYSHFIGFVVMQQQKLNWDLSRVCQLWRLTASILFDSKEQVVSFDLEIFVRSKCMEVVFLVHRLENAFIRNFRLIEDKSHKRV